MSGNPYWHLEPDSSVDPRDAEIARLREELAKASRAMNEKVKAADDAEKIATAATNALERLRSATLEEAAQVCDVWGCNSDDGRAEDIAKAIRALKVSSTPTPAPVEAKTCHNCANVPLDIGSAVCKECCDSSERIRWVPEKKSQLPKLTVEEVKELRSRMLVSPETEVVLRETFTAPIAGQCVDCGNSMHVDCPTCRNPGAT